MYLSKILRALKTHNFEILEAIFIEYIYIYFKVPLYLKGKIYYQCKKMQIMRRELDFFFFFPRFFFPTTEI